MNIFAKLGIDITDKQFWDRGLDEIEKLLNDTEALAKKLGKIKK
jgi:oligoendopeptidase F